MKTFNNLQVRVPDAYVEFSKEKIEHTIAHCFVQQAERRPEHTAFKSPKYCISYRKLHRWSNSIAHEILNICNSQGKFIALALEHDAPMIAAMLGTWKSGNAFVALDPETPFKANEVKVVDSESIVVITNDNNMGLAKALANNRIPVINIDKISSEHENMDYIYATPDTPTYLLYTSGSTGIPKGTMQIHRNVLNFIRNYTNTVFISQDDRLSLVASYSFSAALMDIIGALVNGATVFSWNLRLNGFEGMSEWITNERITIFHSTPTVLRHFSKTITGKEDFKDLRLLYIAGEGSSRRDFEIYKKYFSSHSALICALGSTELAIITQFHADKDTEIDGDYVPLGTPVENTQIMLLNEQNEEVKEGEVGEIVIKCPYLAIGYWNKPEINSRCFRVDKDGDRIFYSSDMARLKKDGQFEYMGRKDTQVNLRGYRIILGELDVLIGNHPDVQEATVLAREDVFEDMCLVAYIEPKKGRCILVSDIRSYLKDTLPEVMIPSYFVFLDQMPITTNGKTDRKALPKPTPFRTRPEMSNNYATPMSVTECKLAELWADMINVDKVGLNDNFFDLGGTSLVAMQLVIKVNQIFNTEIPLERLLREPDIFSMAKIIDVDKQM